MSITLSNTPRVLRIHASGERNGLTPIRCRPGNRRRRHYDKDVLRTGTFHVSGHLWTVTRSMLRRLVANWRLAARRGIRVPVVWNHSTDARDQIGEIAGLYVVGDVLRCRFWAADPQAIGKLGVTVNEVSVEIRQPWTDGAGNVYDIMITHLGVVNLPVVAGQQTFKRLNQFTGVLAMHDPQSHSPTAAGTSIGDPPAGPLEPAELVRSINDVLDACHAPQRLGDETTSEDVIPSLDALTLRLRTAEVNVPVDDASASRPGDVQDAAAAGELVRLRLELDQARQDLELQRSLAQEERKRSFIAAVDRLVHQGRIAPAHKQTLLEAGAPASYSLSLLTPFEDLPAGVAMPVDRIARRGATADPPAISPRTRMTPERARQVAKEFVP